MDIRADWTPRVSGQRRPPDITVRPPVSGDIFSLAELFLEMQSHYGRPVPLSAAIKAATRASMRPEHDFDPRTLLAVAGEKIAGSIVLNVSFPAFELTHSLYIRDLYIARAMRRSGIGRALVKAAARLAVNEGFSALEWTTDSKNAAARRMYESCGARDLERTYYRLFDQTLLEAAAAE